MAIPIGIDDLNLYASTLAIESSEIVAARGISDKDFQNVGFMRRSVAPTFEDPVTLAVNAAKPIVDAAGPDNFELLIVATETGLDYGKPLSSYVHKYLGLGHHCRNFEAKHACYAGTAALQVAAPWVHSGVAPGKKALVVMTDIARPHFNLLEELVPGTGAIALSIAAEPRVLELEAHSGYASQEVYDVSRPTPTYEWVDPVLSLCAYLDLLEMAWEGYQRAVGSVSFEQHFAYMLYHTPLVSLIKQAHQLLLESDHADVTKDEIAASFERMVRPSLRYNLEIGNTYSGSLYTALAGLVGSVPSLDPGTRIGLFSYGSGACAELYSGLVREQAHATVAAKRIGERLAARRKLSIAEYEAALLALERNLVVAEFEPDWETPPGLYEEAYHGKGLLVLERVSNYHRVYKWS